MAKSVYHNPAQIHDTMTCAYAFLAVSSRLSAGSALSQENILMLERIRNEIDAILVQCEGKVSQSTRELYKSFIPAGSKRPPIIGV